MRIIAGKHRSRNIDAPEGKSVRPTTDRMRERIFSMLQHHRYPALLNARVADLYAGTGALGLEALSRGAGHATFVEKTQSTFSCLKKNVASLGEDDNTSLMKISARSLPFANEPYDIIFMDPPYHKGMVEPTLYCLLERNWLAEDGVIIAELAVDDELTIPDALTIIDDRKQGQQRILFMMKA